MAIDLSQPAPEAVIIVGVHTPDRQSYTTNEYLDELEFLVQTAGGACVQRFIQQLPAPDSRTYIGSGKVLEVKAAVAEHEAGLVVFDDELSPTQQRNLEKELECKVVDRTNLILDIFAQRARTAYAKKQVELAQYQYLLPRLAGLWTHLERQRGGIGMRGPGEREIETDRRIVRDRISKLKGELAQIDRQMATQRQTRGQLVRVALVGYTNVGKSTIMNLLGAACPQRADCPTSSPILSASFASSPPSSSNRSNPHSTRYARPTCWCMWSTSPTPAFRSR